MLVIFVFAFLVFSILVLVTLDRIQIRPAIIWLFAAVVAAVTWIGLFSMQFQLPQKLSIMTWDSEVVVLGSLWIDSPSLLLDSNSWSFAIALSTIALGLVFTLVIHDQEKKIDSVIDSSYFLTIFGLLVLGLISVFSANPLVLVMTWGGIDLFELFTILKNLPDGHQNNIVIFNFFGRVLGILLVLWGVIIARNNGVFLQFEHVYHRARIFLLWASVFRLGVFPLRLNYTSDMPHQHGLGLMMRTTLVATSLVLIPRATLDGSLEIFTPSLLGVAGLVALYGGLNWLLVREPLDGSSFWMIGFAAIAIATAINGQALVSQSWGVGLLLGWGIIALYKVRKYWLRIVVIIELFVLSVLPFSISNFGFGFYTGTVRWFAVMYLIALAVLIAGLIRHTLRDEDGWQISMRGVWMIYVLGLGVFPLTHVIVGLRLLAAEQRQYEFWWQGVFVIVLSVLFVYATDRVSKVFPVIFSTIRSISLNWIYRLFGRGYQVLVKLVSFLTMLLEGEGGVLWALLLLSILISLITQLDFGN